MDISFPIDASKSVVPAMLRPAWTEIQSEIKKSLGESTFEIWFSDLVLIAVGEGNMSIAAPNAMYPIWIEENFKDVLHSAIGNYFVNYDHVNFEVPNGSSSPNGSDGFSVEYRGTLSSGRKRGGSAKKGKGGQKKKLVSEVLSDEELTARGLAGGLVDIHRFENFVVGENSEIAHAAARAVSEKPGRTYQPLFYHSACGLGKTHLLHAIGWESLRLRPKSKVFYVTAEKFANDYIDAIHKHGLVAFRKKYREADLLLIDDVQFLGRKEGLQREFFHTFNSLADMRKQIVLASDCPASEIDQLEDRLVSRFQWGLTAEIHKPGDATREAILRRKRDDWSLDVPDHVISQIVDRVHGNVRLLEGALIRVAMSATMTEGEITPEIVDGTLADICGHNMSHLIGIEEIKRAVAENYNLDIKILEGKGRTARVAEARQVAMYLIRTMTDHSLVEVASAFGKDHGTVIYAVKKIKGKCDSSPSMKNTVELIRRRLVRGNGPGDSRRNSVSGPAADRFNDRATFPKESELDIEKEDFGDYPE